MPASERRSEIAKNLLEIRQRIDQAINAHHRDRSEITLIAVTKNFPTSDLLHLYDLGIRNFGENREQEGSVKFAEFNTYIEDPSVNWHFQGQLQRNKLRSIATWANYIHSLDQERYLAPLQLLSEELEKPISLLLQFSLDLPIRPDRGGVAPETLLELGKKVIAFSGLKLKGLMTVAPLDVAPELAFAALKTISSTFLRAFPDANWLSAGMSGDFEAAIGAGATHIRVGTSILGSR